ncbi:MAG: helix-turn-helix domain-containing protein [Pseudomonadota bacterium]
MDMDKIIGDVAQLLNVSILSIIQGKRGKKNIPRSIAMYLCQEMGDHRLIDIAHKFGLKRTGSIPITITKLKVLLDSDIELKNKLKHYFTCPPFF